LGKQYSAACIQQRCQQQGSQDQDEGLRQSSQQDKGSKHEQSANPDSNTGLLATLANTIEPTEDKSYVPNQLKNQQKRRRRLSNRL
jgi:hypothetical protein